MIFRVKPIFPSLLSIRFCCASMNVGNSQVFQGRQDRFKGVTVDSRKEPCDASTFTTKLTDSLHHWKEQKMRGIWFKVALENADWVPILAKNNFSYHHARNKSVMMVRWLPENETSSIPPYCHTMISIGGLVTDSQGRMLVVKEKVAIIPIWKLPGGYIEQKEDIPEAVVREVFEETGIHTTFNSLIGFMHGHTSQFGCSDIYFIAHLSPVDENQPLNKCDREIADCCWMKFEEYLEHSEVIGLGKMLVRKFLDVRESMAAMPFKKFPHPIFQDKQVTIFALQGDAKPSHL